jgi:hypothetical protein
MGSGPVSSLRIRVQTGRAPYWIVAAFTAAPAASY